MAAQNKTPEPLAGGNRSLKLIEATRLNDLKFTLSSNKLQGKAPYFDPLAMPIIAAYWFGLYVAKGSAA